MRGIFLKLSLFLALFLLSSCNETVIKNAQGGAINPAACSDQPITYASVNNEVFAKSCATCHTGGNVDLSTYAGAKANAQLEKSAVLTNHMPPTGPIDYNDKSMLLSWINQGSPLNAGDANMSCAGMKELQVDE